MPVQCPQNNLKRYRRISGYSQQEVARMLGISYTTSISRWEKGVLYPSIEQLFVLATLYNALPHELYPTEWQQSKRIIAKIKTKTPLQNEYFYL